ncbi:unnamed protein product [Albugo candida]|uniref:PP2A regulatory subunit B'' EF-hand domain-containing protein n=2 Tax=Albugo candida TaxID=65357 RepID=A0A024GH07_9STRA|nr:unnamed protein product [Albugo candida]|eukprot:CCI46044.1 unnamed protein product [Albugo candida]
MSTNKLAISLNASDDANEQNSVKTNTQNESNSTFQLKFENTDSLVQKMTDFESAHTYPSGRLKMEELFRQWLNAEGTKTLIHSLVEDARKGKDLHHWDAHNCNAASPKGSQSPTSSFSTLMADGHPGTLLHSPSRSPKRPPNPMQQHNSPTGPSYRKKTSANFFAEDFLLNQPCMNTKEESGCEKSRSSRKVDSEERERGQDKLVANQEASNAASQKDKSTAITIKACEDVQMEDVVMNDTDVDAIDTVQNSEKCGSTVADEKASSCDGGKGEADSVTHIQMSSDGVKRLWKKSYTDLLDREIKAIESRFEKHPEGMNLKDFVTITKDFCDFPSFFNAPFFNRVVEYCRSVDDGCMLSDTEKLDDDSLVVSKDMFRKYWVEELSACDTVERFFRVIKQRYRSHIERDDFAPFMHELLKYHPGLDFLASTPEFQEKYVARIFYSVDRDSSGKITLRKLRRSNLIAAFNLVDEEGDINKVSLRDGKGSISLLISLLCEQVNAYFSYEHFYVLYCKFWELDTDRDFSLSADDLVRYGGHALTRIIVDRIFEHGRRPFARIQTLSPEEKKKMSYEDFIYFMLSEEDKSNPISLKYWFELIDIYGNNVIRAEDMRVLYRHQVHRMECLGHDVIPFEDILCQLSDLLNPQRDGEFVYQDFIREDKIRVAGVFFNVLFNLNKFVEFEQRDPFLLRQQLAEPELSDWDRYACAEYARLAMEEEGQEEDNSMDIDTIDGWYVSDAHDEDIDLLSGDNTESTLAENDSSISE